MSTPSDTPAPAPRGPLGTTHPAEAPKPSFKVTRSPFAPRIIGQGDAEAQDSSAAFGAAFGSAPPRPALARKTASGGSGGGGDTSAAGLLVDFVCAAVAIAAAVMMWLHSR